MKRIVLIICLLSAAGQAFSQVGWFHRRDSLLMALAVSKEDTARVWTQLNLGILYLDNHPDSSLYYADAFGHLSRKLNYPLGIINSLSMRASIIATESKANEAISLDLEGIQLAKQANLKGVLANVYNNLAKIYSETKEDYSTSLDYNLKALELYEQRHDLSRMAMSYSNIGLVYNSLKEYRKGYLYSLQGISLYRSMNKAASSRSGMLSLSTSLIYLKRYDTALTVLTDAKSMSDTLNDINYAMSVGNRFVTIYTKTGRLALLRKSSGQLLVLSRRLNDAEGMCQAWSGLSDYYFYKKDYKESLAYNKTLMDSAKAYSRIALMASAYERLAKIELAKGRLAGYDHYKELQDSLEDLVLSDKILKNSQDLEAKYSLDKKQTQINSLNDEKKISSLILRQGKTMNWILIGVILVFAVIGFLFYSNTRQKKKLLLSETALQHQKITELEKEKQLLTTRSVLLGQDEERKRLAKDLHDGLGGILSVTKYSFNNMKQRLIISPEDAVAFDRSMGYLDRAIQELRRVAHNMMPEALVEFGLDTALKDYCNSITNSGAMKITYQSFEMTDQSMLPDRASVIYRIVQELINNILKHAHTTTALVQMVKRSDALSITVEDNGQGFDIGLLENSPGIGFLNLRNRVSYLGGAIDVQTAPGKGTSVTIEIPDITV